MCDKDTYVCNYCGFHFDSPAPFIKKRRFIFSPKKLYCKSCVDEAVDNRLLKSLLSNILLLCLALFFFQVQHNPQLAWLIVNVVVLGVLGVFVTFLHELGHAFTATALKMRVYGIEIGQGKKLVSIKFGDYPVTINKIPFLGGMTFVGFYKDDKESLVKMALVYLAGPVINLIIFLLLLWFIGLDELIAPVKHGFDGVDIFTLLAIDNFLVFLKNIIPYSFNVNGIRHETDGKFLLLSLFRKNKVKSQLRTSTLHSYGMESINKKEFSDAAEWFKKGMCEFPENILFHFLYASSLYYDKNYEGTKSFLCKVLNDDLINDENQFIAANIYNLYAWTLLLQSVSENLELANEYSEKACEILKNEASMLDTRGYIEVELENFDKGKELLLQALTLTPILSHKAAGLCGIAISELKQGNVLRANKLYQYIIKMKQQPDHLDRLALMLGSAKR